MTIATSMHARLRPTAAGIAQSATTWNLTVRILVGAAAVAAVGAPALGIVANLPLVLIAVPVVLILAWGRYGRKMLAVYLGVTLTVATVFENLSITTGFPFGHYHYPGTSLRIWHFPVFIAVSYCALGMICWLLAAALLDGADRRLADRNDPARRVNVIAVPALAAALMTMYDLGSDSVASTIAHVWVWENGGGVFGVPWTNYLGWWFVSYVFFQVFALVLASRSAGDLPGTDHGREPLAHAVALYLLLAAGSLGGFISARDDTVTDLAGAAWSTHALHESMFTINLFGAVVIAALAVTKLARNDLARHQP